MREPSTRRLRIVEGASLEEQAEARLRAKKQTREAITNKLRGLVGSKERAEFNLKRRERDRASREAKLAEERKRMRTEKL